MPSNDDQMKRIAYAQASKRLGELQAQLDAAKGEAKLEVLKQLTEVVRQTRLLTSQDEPPATLH